MEFLDGAATAAKSDIWLALARLFEWRLRFGGDGASTTLGLDRIGAAATVICNLKSGGTNPEEIETLIATKKSRSSNAIHCTAKVYLFDEGVIYRFFERFGEWTLHFRGSEVSGWEEANSLH